VYIDTDVAFSIVALPFYVLLRDVLHRVYKENELNVN